VKVVLCRAHASPEFQLENSGRDFVLTLQRLWDAHGCLTQVRSRALNAHLETASAHPTPTPGSYAWPDTRAWAERQFAAGDTPKAVMARLEARRGSGDPVLPSARTVRRWFTDRRWLILG
jgi:hypothetical protein